MKKKHYTGPKSVYNPVEQLFWREYFYQLSYKNENFYQVDGNKMCFKIPWDYHGKLDLINKWQTVSWKKEKKNYLFLKLTNRVSQIWNQER